MEKDFKEAFSKMQKECHQTAKNNGWWEDGIENRNVGEAICLMHSELSEALEAYRAGDPPDDKIPEFSGMEAELADTIIRIMDFAEASGMRVAEAIVAKNEMNKTRGYKHGGKKI